MNKGSLLTLEALFSVVIALVGAVAMIASFTAGFGKLDDPGAGLFPFFAGLAILVGGAVVTAGAVLRGLDAPAAEFEPGAPLRLAALAGTFAGWILMMPLTGFVLGTFLCVLAFAKVLGLEGWPRPLLLAGATALGVYVMFARMLYLDLPTGVFG